MEIQIISSTNLIDSNGIRDLLDRAVRPDAAAAIEIRKPRQKLKAAESTLMVAIVGASGAVIGALITGFLQIVREGRAQKVVIQTKSGTKLEVPKDIESEELDLLIDKIKKLESDGPQILLL